MQLTIPGGLDSATGYYLEVEFYATINGVEVISSDAAYLGASCGGNITGYQVTTLDENNFRIHNISTDIKLTDVIVDGTPLTGFVSGENPTYDNEYSMSTGSPVDITIGWEEIFIPDDIISLYDTYGVLQWSSIIAVGPADSHTVTGVDMTGPNQLLIELTPSV